MRFSWLTIGEKRNVSAKAILTAPLEALLSVRDLMELTGFSRISIYRMHAAGQLPRALVPGSRRLRWTADSIRAWLVSLEKEARDV